MTLTEKLSKTSEKKPLPDISSLPLGNLFSEGLRFGGYWIVRESIQCNGEEIKLVYMVKKRSSEVDNSL